MKILLIRHGESLANKIGMVQGWINVDLTHEGYEQAKKLGQRLSDYSFDIVYASPLRRAHNTAKEITSFHNNQEIILDDRLKERDHGKANGLLRDRITEDIWNQYKKDPHFKLDEQGDSINDVFERVKPFYNEVLLNPQNKDKTICIVSHGGVTRMLVHLLLGNESIKEVEDIKYGIENTCVYEIEFSNNKAEFIRSNCIKHLE